LPGLRAPLLARLIGPGLLVASAWAAAAAPLVFGIFPNLTPKVLIETYRPLADALEANLGRPVELYTAPDFARFAAATRRGEFDLVLTAPHLAWRARRDSGYRPILKYARPVRGILAVKTGSAVSAVQQLRNKRVAAASPLALTVMAMEQQLTAAGLVPGSDFITINAESHSNAAMQAYAGAAGAADAAILGEQPFRQLPAEVRAGLTILAETPPLSGQVFLTHPRLSDAEAQAIHRALLRYAETPQGRRFIAHGGFGGLVRLDGRELQNFKRYPLETQRLLSTRVEPLPSR
jgi:phosphonate transport system substrate-binding protein